MSNPKFQYFETLFSTSLRLVDRVPLTAEAPLMGYITGTLEPAVVPLREEGMFAEPLPGMFSTDDAAAAPIDPRQEGAAGLNTMGMLLDRLSILAIKHWNLVNRARAPDKAAQLAETQVVEIVSALAFARRGSSSINNKMTNRSVAAGADSFAAAYAGLLTTNLLLWEAQEILYNHDILALPGEELRAYIDFFSRGNLSRNMFIQSSDGLFWEAGAA